MLPGQVAGRLCRLRLHTLAGLDRMAPAPARLALAALEERGYISAGVEGDRVGRTVRYSVDRSKVSEDASAFLGRLLR